MDATLLYPVAVTLLPDATKEVFATVMSEASWPKDANPIEATASFPEADTRHPTHVREVPVAVMVELARYDTKPIHATPFDKLADPLAVTLDLNAVREVFVVEIADKPAENTPETMPMDAMTCNPATVKLDSVAAKVVFTATMVADMLPRDTIPKHTRAPLPLTTRLLFDAAANVFAAATEDNLLPYATMPMHATT